MADCSYSRCVQERRNIRRELQKWTKNMVYIVGLERIAEELMGRRKWKLYQECIFRSQHQQQLPINNNVLDSKIKQEIVENDEQERLKDWSPQSKCYFCVDGKLDSDHTTRGALSPRPSDSESSDSPSDSEAPPTLTPSLHLLKNSVRHGHAGSRLPGAGAMTSLVPPAAAAAAAAAGLPFYPPLFASAPNWYLSSLARNLHQQQRDADADKPGSVTTAEQPLDLSAKPGHSNMSRIPAIDTKQIFKAKPRMSAVSGRRTYTEEELQAALRDIQSGKLGTRRAAVIYGIPRSTLRNKVYKLAMERERESHLAPLSTLADDDVMDDERELSGAEEEKEVEKALQAPLLSAADIARIADTPEALRTLLLQQQQLKSGNSKEDGWAGLEHSALGPYIQLMMAEQLAGKEQGLVSILPELMRKIIGEEEQINNGETDSKTQPLPQPSPSNSIKVKTESSDMDTDDSPANVILKIPSFKPTSNKNGGDIYRSDTGAIVSPPVTSESGSPPIVTGNMLSLREAIAKSISQKFQQSPGPEPLTRHSTPMEIDYKRVGITPPLVGLTSSIKNHHHQTQPPSDSATPPAISSTPGLSHARNLQSTTVVNNSTTKSHTLSNSNNVVTNANAQGGKGTRPKRGKYRNYDRDSLVEAVRAVQRGEMSVHRAGSYYGVPHSTLEYKVKERHLMRPRKRDPKPNPVDEKIASIKSQEIRNIPDKMKTVIKPPQKFPPTSPNGMKMPAMFDTPLAPLGYTPPPFPFWPHPSPFPHLPLDYPRNPSTSQFATNPEYYASQMMQQLQERSGRCHGDGASTVAAGGANGTNNSGTSASLAKSAREMAESLYDGTGSNGSFLDGIIRSSLESGVPNAADSSGNKEDKNIAPENLSNKALLDQLCRNSRITPLPKPTNTEPSTPSEENYVTSPLNFLNRNITEETSLGKNGKCRNRDDIQTIELSNDSNESTDVNTNEDDIPISNSAKESPPPPSRIYVKPQFQELTKPENLKPEVLVRFRTASDEPEPRIAPDSNGLSVVVDTGSASDKTEVALD